MSAATPHRRLLSASSHRRLLCASSVAVFGAVFAAFVFFEVPGLGIGHCFYLPIALTAMAYGTRGGALGGGLASALYVLGIVINPNLPMTQVLTVATGIRLVMFTSAGILIGFFAGSNDRLVGQLTELAERDFLTGLLNARVFDAALARRCAAGEPFVLVLADMDNLKVINDEHGHAEGNRALRMVADVLVSASDSDAELARVGGDEFGLLMYATAESAPDLCSRLEQRVRAAGLQLSFGWAASGADGREPSDLFHRADGRLYAAKLKGRNRRAVLTLAAAANSSAYAASASGTGSSIATSCLRRPQPIAKASSEPAATTPAPM